MALQVVLTIKVNEQVDIRVFAILGPDYRAGDPRIKRIVPRTDTPDVLSESLQHSTRFVLDVDRHT